jgi:hypothetical protein
VSMMSLTCTAFLRHSMVISTPSSADAEVAPERCDPVRR